mmetsp:Transcript_29656/g.45353  ORF Transcript_29656/g.45353 Transcript_29656/m.45353 type:complete len:266 (+) Transcript_29656:117-914(+)|eukprot:CAMPEP_0194086994 /NCGR_PEP_ID=MMETSP0149-20130528/23360_1 /TAXON_ID=122233 /ORGANISM="Chaetoceros debilis, Strain MM31A-1" /LENGTH=265 /DNA_ID=CAMNT_0038770231 /DNA_START=88 /DNA_END=885 /DNA_ORIENTATION=-
MRNQFPRSPPSQKNYLLLLILLVTFQVHTSKVDAFQPVNIATKTDRKASGANSIKARSCAPASTSAIFSMGHGPIHEHEETVCQSPQAQAQAQSQALSQSLSQSLSYTVEVIHQNMKTTVNVSPDETILQALERSNVHDTLALPSLPNDCRRGNCLTCSGRHTPESQVHNVEIGEEEHGLSPSMKNTVEKKGVVLTCCSHVTGDGVQLELGVNDEVWRSVYASGDDKEGERIRTDAVAKTMRLNDERNLKKWAKKTERMLELSDE